MTFGNSGDAIFDLVKDQACHKSGITSQNEWTARTSWLVVY
jgi:hypothetical protein